MEYQITPYESVGPIKFSMTQQEVQTALNEHYETFRRGPFATGDTETYGQCFVNYDAAGHCDSVEFFGDANVKFKETSPFSLSCAELRKLLAPVEDNDSGFTSFEYGIGVYAPYEEDEPDKVESIIAFKKGYYD